MSKGRRLCPGPQGWRVGGSLVAVACHSLDEVPLRMQKLPETAPTGIKSRVLQQAGPPQWQGCPSAGRPLGCRTHLLWRLGGAAAPLLRGGGCEWGAEAPPTSGLPWALPSPPAPRSATLGGHSPHGPCSCVSVNSAVTPPARELVQRGGGPEMVAAASVVPSVKVTSKCDECSQGAAPPHPLWLRVGVVLRGSPLCGPWGHIGPTAPSHPTARPGGGGGRNP